jgi:hypothetical protein
MYLNFRYKKFLNYNFNYILKVKFISFVKQNLIHDNTQ